MLHYIITKDNSVVHDDSLVWLPDTPQKKEKKKQNMLSSMEKVTPCFPAMTIQNVHCETTIKTIVRPPGRSIVVWVILQHLVSR